MGKSEWRLPTIDELQNMFDREKGKPKIDGFMAHNYWSSTVLADDINRAWIVFFSYGYTHGYFKSYTGYVRCVKKNEKGKLEWSESSKKKMTWDEANEWCKELNKPKWRLPTINELQGMFDYDLGRPKIDGFMLNRYWSSTPCAGYASYAWYVYFYSGDQSHYVKDNDACVRSV